MYMSFDHFDRAYVEYLMASSIVVDLVPHHKDYPDVRSGRGTVCALNKALQIVGASCALETRAGRWIDGWLPLVSANGVLF